MNTPLIEGQPISFQIPWIDWEKNWGSLNPKKIFWPTPFSRILPCSQVPFSAPSFYAYRVYRMDSYRISKPRGGRPGGCDSGYWHCVFQVLKSYYLKIISTILHPSEWASVLARNPRFWGIQTAPTYWTVASLSISWNSDIRIEKK